MSFDLVFEVDIATRVYFYLRRICQQTYSDTRSFVTNHKFKRTKHFRKCPLAKKPPVHLILGAVYEPGFVKNIQKNKLQKHLSTHESYFLHETVDGKI